jgi:hypothetical protein
VIRLRVKTGVNILEPTTFAFLIIGCMIPYWLAALTMKSVGKAAGDTGIPNRTQRFIKIRDWVSSMSFRSFLGLLHVMSCHLLAIPPNCSKTKQNHARAHTHTQILKDVLCLLCFQVDYELMNVNDAFVCPV